MDPGDEWTPSENKAFEEALDELDLNSEDWLEQLMSRFPNKTSTQLMVHYLDLVVAGDKAGNFPDLSYNDDSSAEIRATPPPTVSSVPVLVLDGEASKENFSVLAEGVVETREDQNVTEEDGSESKGKRPAEEREAPKAKKGSPWTEEEHREFLVGLNIYGRGAWAKISKNFVHSRTPIQVASHAQKFFYRMSTEFKERRHYRPSILDITTIDSLATKPQISTAMNESWDLRPPTCNAKWSGSSFIPQEPFSFGVDTSRSAFYGNTSNNPE